MNPAVAACSAVIALAADGVTSREAVEQVAAAAAGAMGARAVPGMALAAVKGGESAFAGLGVRDADGRPVTPDTRFYVASCTKAYTALLLAKLAEQDELELDDPLRAVLPRFALADEEAAAGITLRDLLCHRPGLNCGAAVFLDAFTGEITDERFFRFLARERPSGRCQYTNTHFTLAARAAEAVRGEPWQELLASELLEPAGMTRTTARASVAYADEDCAWPLDRGGTGWRGLRVKSDLTMHAAGGLCTTARDAATWIGLHLARGSIGGRRIVAPETIEETMALQEKSAEEEGGFAREGFGLAWNVGRFQGRRFALHSGDYLGYAAKIVVLPDEGIGAAVLANSDASRVVQAAALALVARMVGGTVPDELGWLATQPVPVRAAPTVRGATAAEAGAPLESCAGTFRNDDFGTLALRIESGRLVGSIGEYPFELLAGGAGSWRLAFDGGARESPAQPSFAEGRLAALEVHLLGRPIRFGREDGGPPPAR